MLQPQRIPVNDAAAFGKVAVLLGVRSAERKVSLKSGRAVLTALCAQGVNAHGINAGPDVLQVLATGGYDRAFIVLHGRGGKDGVTQGALETLGLPYTGSGVLASALGIDRLRTKQVCCPCGLPPEREVEWRQLVLRAFTALDGYGWGRVDFMVDAQRQPWLLEVSTVPGMTDHSLVPIAARAMGLDFQALVWRILETSLEWPA